VSVCAFLALLVLAPLSPPAGAPAATAPRWGERGHRVVAELAWRLLSPAARSRAEGLLGGESPAEVSTWADDVRPARRETAPWHYVNIPIWEAQYDADRHCPEGNCVVAAIHRFAGVLGDAGRPDAERAEALRFLVHFVGDLHQPLHAGDRGDRGGNDVRVTVDGRERNLHSVWDGDMVNRLADSAPALSARLEARLLALPADTLAAWQAGGSEAWAMESQALSRERVYRLPRDGVLERRYFEANAEAVEQQLLRAAVRLAALLEAQLR
jgi:nuclease S1